MRWNVAGRDLNLGYQIGLQRVKHKILKLSRVDRTVTPPIYWIQAR